MSVKSVFKNTAAVILAALFLAMAGCKYNLFPDPFYIPGAFIEGVPDSGQAGRPLTLTGTVRPAFASNTDIDWSVKDAGTTEAVIHGNILNANAGGTVVVTARIPNGLAQGKDYTQNFIIVIGAGNPNEGELLTLSGDITIIPNIGVTIGTELTALYDGSEAVSYQWKKDGFVVGTDSNKYTPSVAGSYTVTVNAFGYHSKTSAVVDVSDPSLLNLSGTITITPNSDVTTGTELTAVYDGSETVSYQWKKDGIVVGTDSNKYTPTSAGSYTVTVIAEGYNPKTSAAVNVVVEYTILIDMFGDESGDTITASPNKGVEGVTVTLAYTVANTAIYNQLDFGGVTAVIASVESAESGTRTYIINAADASTGVITITAVFTHTDLIIDHISFSEHDKGHITKTYGDAPFINAITNAHQGKGAITYHSSDTDVATVDGSGQVTILKSGSAVISAEKASDETYAHAQTTYTLTVNPKPVTITGLSASDKIYDGTTTATVTGTPVINGLIPGDTVTVVAGTASFADAAAGNNKPVTFSGWSLEGADATHYTLSEQPAPVTANITNPSVEIVIDWTEIDEWQLIEQSAQATANEDKVFTVAGAYTTGYTYQWYLDGELVGTSPTYTFNQPADVYQLVVVVTNSNGEKRSGRCRITVGN